MRPPRSTAIAKCRSLVRGGRRLLQLDPVARRDVFDAQWQLLRARLELATTPSGRMLDLQRGHTPAARPDAAGTERARRLALAVDRAAENGLIRPSCLVRSIALQRLLETRGLSGSRIRIGVTGIPGPFRAHAWVEYGGAVLGDGALAQRFTAFDESAAGAGN